MKSVSSILLMVTAIAIISCQNEEVQQFRWEAINLNYTGDINDISVLSEDTIMLLSGIDKTFEQTCILESDDAGKTWKKRCFDILDISGFSSFYCFNHLKIFATGRGLFQSNNGGYSWKKIGDNGGQLYFISKNEGFLLSGYSIYKTTNGGTSFEMVHNNTSFKSFRFIQLLNNKVGYASGGIYNGIIVKTTDGGDTWQTLPQIFKGIAGMSFITAEIGYIILYLSAPQMVIGTSGTRVELLKTTDGGNTWTSINDRIYDKYQAIPLQCYLKNERTGFILAYSRGNKILSTSDGGKTWKEEYSYDYPNFALLKMVFTSSGSGYAIGNNGIILKRTQY